MGGGASSCNKKLVDASRRGVIKEMEAAFKKGADPNSKDEHGNTALICAAQRGQAKACELLIQKKAEVDFLNKSDKTAVHYATKDGDKEYNATLKVLLDAGAHADIYDEIRQTPLFYTAWFGNLEMTTMLLEKGAKVDNQTPGGDTPLHGAAKMGKLEICKLLVEKGADTKKKDGQDRTALDCAEYMKTADCVEYLKTVT
mmetsp:Transcript_5992/g.14079  ORF Transcript_5992/g.14079 Transcript_5992/m.14079 type:complete len:200 (-) Transcript_5992:50-649(-)